MNYVTKNELEQNLTEITNAISLSLEEMGKDLKDTDKETLTHMHTKFIESENISCEEFFQYYSNVDNIITILYNGKNTYTLSFEEFKKKCLAYYNISATLILLHVLPQELHKENHSDIFSLAGALAANVLLRTADSYPDAKTYAGKIFHLLTNYLGGNFDD